MRDDKQVTIAIDAMGGDHAPKEVIKGAIAAASRGDARLIAVGDQPTIQRYLNRLNSGTVVEIVHAPERIDMGENPALAIRKKKNSSIVVAAELVRQGRADAMVSAGSTGASMAVAALILGRATGIDRPAIATILPTCKGQTILLDVGANVDCTVENLMQFAVMGNVYARDVLGVESPKVGLLSIGEEPTKGNDLVKSAHKRLEESGLNFVGNIEGGPLFDGQADVVVCDGFVGNVALKVAEGVVGLFRSVATEKLLGHPVAKVWNGLMLLGLAPALKKIHKQMDPTEYGGAPLLGVNGICIICHGNSKAKSIANAVGVAMRAHRTDMLGRIRGALEQTHGKAPSAGDARAEAVFTQASQQKEL